MYDDDPEQDYKRIYDNVNLEIERIIEDNSQHKGLYQIVEVINKSNMLGLQKDSLND